MLVLTRKLNEKIVIGEDITITVCEIGQGRIRLGIECPRSVPVKRAELTPYVKTCIEYRADASDPRPFAEGGAE